MENCSQCKHFFITWDSRFPYGCKLYEIKSKTSPATQILVNTGIGCQGYQPKQKHKAQIVKNPKV